MIQYLCFQKKLHNMHKRMRMNGWRWGSMLTGPFPFCTEFTSQPQALPQRADRQTRDGEAEVGDGVQRVPGVGGRLHEHAGEGIKQNTCWTSVAQSRQCPRLSVGGGGGVCV